MANLETILSWFQTGDKPTEEEFKQTFSSFRHNDTKIPIIEVDGLESSLNNKLNVDDLPASMALVDEGETSDVFNKEQIMAMAMMLSDYVKDGKIRADKIEAMGLTDLIESIEKDISEFAANSEKYEFQQNDFIAIPDDKGNFSLFIYKGGDQFSIENYLPTGLTNITISMVEGLQNVLNAKLDKPIANGNYFVKMNGTSSYQSINPVSNHLLFWDGNDFKNSNIFRDSKGLKYGIGTTAPSEQLHLTSRARMAGLVLEDISETLPQQITYNNRKFFGTDSTGLKRHFQYADYDGWLSTVNSMTSAQALNIAQLLNGGAGSAGNMSVNLISPPIVQNKFDTVEYILLRGANLNLNALSMGIQILASDKATVVATIPNNQIQLNAAGTDLVFYYNFYQFLEGQYFIRLISGSKIYITTLDLNIVQSTQDVNIDALVWEILYDSSVTPNPNDLAQGRNIVLNTPVSTTVNGIPKIAIKSSEIFSKGDDFYLEYTVNLGPKYGAPDSGRSTVGLCYSSTPNALIDNTILNYAFSYGYNAGCELYNNSLIVPGGGAPLTTKVTIIKTGNLFRMIIGTSNFSTTLSNNSGYSIFVGLLQRVITQQISIVINKAFKFN